VESWERRLANPSHPSVFVRAIIRTEQPVFIKPLFVPF
jgi:hypothetical protein